MKLSSFGLFAGLAASVLAEDYLFVDVFEYEEYAEAIGTLGGTAKVVTETELVISMADPSELGFCPHRMNYKLTSIDGAPCQLQTLLLTNPSSLLILPARWTQPY